MKYLTAEEAQGWLHKSGIKIDHSRDLICDQMVQQETYTVLDEMPNGHLELAYFSNALLRWFPNSRERGLWLKNWNTYPIEPYKFFEQVRRGLGENRNIIEAPFHVIAPTPYTDYEARTPHQADEEASVSGLMLLAMCFDWEFYLLARDCSDYVFVSDNTVLYSTSDPIKIENRNQHEQRGQVFMALP